MRGSGDSGTSAGRRRSETVGLTAIFALLLASGPTLAQAPNCPPTIGAELAADTLTARAHLARAYDLLEADRTADAAEELERALAYDSCRPSTHAQLGYAYTALERPREAIEHLTAARNLGAGDPHLTLQLAYLHEGVGERMTARGYFDEAMREDDAEVAARARAELAVRGAAPGLSITEVYAAPLYQGRFDNFIFPLVVRSGPILTAKRLTQLYAFLRLTRDTRSEMAEQPEIFSENAALIGGGARFRPFGGTFTAYGEAGAGLDLTDPAPGFGSAGPSAQVGIYDFRPYGLQRDSGGEPGRGAFAELYYDASYYSRFDHNAIGYLQLRAGHRTNGWAGGTLDAYLPILAVADGRGLFYNNLLEAGVGARWFPDGLDGVALSVEYLSGRYLRGSGPDGDRYDDVRLMVTTPLYLATDR